MLAKSLTTAKKSLTKGKVKTRVEKIKTTHDRNDLPRPLPHYTEPKSDNERLLNMQYDYKENGNEQALNAMYALGCKIALKYINAKAGKNPHIAHMSDDEKEKKAHNAITYIIARYLRVKDFSIRKSFTSYLYLRVQHELYYQRKVDKIVDFVDWESLRG